MTGSICESRNCRISRQGTSLSHRRQDDRCRRTSGRCRTRSLFTVYPAAEAYIFERTDKAAKTHRGVRSQFGRPARREPGIGRKFLTFLAEAYEFKTIADYGIGPAIDATSADEAASAINTGGCFIDAIAELPSS